MTSLYTTIPDPDVAPGWERAACPLCQATEADAVLTGWDFVAHVPGQFRVVRCRACGFAFTNPRPHGEELNKFYPDDYGCYVPDVDRESLAAELENGRRRRVLNEWFGYGGRRNGFEHARLPSRARRLCERGFPPARSEGGRLLEIGCSYGGFLYQLQLLGWNVDGIELNAKAAAFARDELGLRVVSSPIEEVPPPAVRYDCVVMRMVLEHLRSPVDALRQIGCMMRTGADLLVSIPNFASTEARVFGPYWWALHLPAHMSHFTPESLRRTLKLGGFELERIYWIRSARDTMKSLGNMAEHKDCTTCRRLANSRLFRRTLLKAWLMLSHRAGHTSRMIAYARKVSSSEG